MSNLKTLANPFTFKGHDVRVAVTEQGGVLFHAEDIAKVLGMDKVMFEDAVRLIPGDWRMVLPGSDFIFITEPAVFKLIFHYQSEQAVSLAEWIVQDVLTTLRKHDFFGELNPALRLEYSKTITDLTMQLLSNRSEHIRDVLVAELRDCCNLVGRQLPAAVNTSSMHF
ncbi:MULTISPECIES: BRO-N domain-containing protein [unclassified Methylophaga]|uniref:BRO-N domain-containing protein n=1 Tax=unclassified Methylophaga TaxID=2629249 RepID=UPI00259D123E|nr:MULTISPECIES: BRO family protein [unclassified Methylophaga]|tara:strand:- start:1386 stop:1889 length:504 start_codon:yes stop_codon:yes gene_type:complete